MTSEEVLALAHSAGIFVGKGLEYPGLIGYTLADIQNVLHGATAAYHLTSEEFTVDAWSIQGSLPGMRDVELFVEVRETDKTLVVRGADTLGGISRES